MATIEKAISEAVKAAGFHGTVNGKLYFSLDTAPLLFGLYGEDGENAEHEYLDKIAEVEGVIFDEGQCSGYCFEINQDIFTIDSEHKLRSLVKQYERYSTPPVKP
jgi:hypothetical protein